MIADLRQRESVLSPTGSFIVEAPAGSGKTELLTQRFLALLNTVEVPEQILAISFTRKAAAEMRQRIVETLRAAADDSLTVPAHRRVSVELARRVLLRSEGLNWSLLEQTQRLRILTIDALNAGLARQLPILSSGIMSADVTDNADGLYRAAARRTTEALAEAGILGQGLRVLLGAAGNSLDLLESWLASTLPQRDRWLRLIDGAGDWNLKSALEQGLARLLALRLTAIREQAGPELQRNIRELLQARAVHLANGSGFVQENSDLAIWREAAALLFTRAGSLRQRFTRREGFPPDDKGLRELLQGVLSALEDKPALKSAIAGLVSLPAAEPEREQQRLLAAAAPVLQRLLAELRLAFVDSRTVDHTELALAALQALGAVDAPSDLLLALDRRIEHVLVDEFQDTSHLQWALLERMTAGWQPDDGRTLFLVGDPRQSIYRFRDADLSLFLRAAREGIGDLRLQAVRLTVNFRSAPELVAWVNTAFAEIFGGDEDPASGLPAFLQASPGRESGIPGHVELHDLTGGSYADEIARVVELARRESEASPAASIGILVRSRSHLLGLRAALAAADLPAQAIEIDSLTDTQFGLDLVALTAALLHDGDRLAWLSVLRGPTVGIGWMDLHALVAGHGERPIPELLADPVVLAGLSDEARRRIGWFSARLEAGRPARAWLTLGRWVRSCWQLIDGPAALGTREDLDTAEHYFAELDRRASAGDLDDPARLAEWFSRPSGGESPPDSGIEIMTIHRAKGLEFDTVIIPGIGKSTRSSSSNLLVIQEIIVSPAERVSLAAVSGKTADPLIDYLRQLEREHEAAERARLLYVAVTRARNRLHLVGALDGDADKPRSGSLLETLWPGIVWPDPEVRDARAAAASADTDPETSARDAADRDAPDAGDPPAYFVDLPLRRLSLAEAVPLPAPDRDVLQATGSARPEFEWVHPASVQVGTLIHRELQRWAEAAALAGVLQAPVPDPARYRRELALLGVETEDLEPAARRIGEALENVWRDPIGRWILKPRAEAWSELKFSRRTRTGIVNVQLDRSFVTGDGVRWIIDYKTGRHLGANVEEFLDSEVERYREQLATYARVVAAVDSRPLRVGLYFPLLGKLRDYSPDLAGPDLASPDLPSG